MKKKESCWDISNNIHTESLEHRIMCVERDIKHTGVLSCKLLLKAEPDYMEFFRPCSTEFWILPRVEILEFFLVHFPVFDFPYAMSVGLGLFSPCIGMYLIAAYDFCLLFNCSILLSMWLQLTHVVGVWGSWGAIRPFLSTHFFRLNNPDSQLPITCLVL